MKVLFQINGELIPIEQTAIPKKSEIVYWEDKKYIVGNLG